MKFDKKYISTRITVIVVMAVLLVIAIIARAVVTATVENEKWKELGAVSVGDTLPMPAAPYPPVAVILPPLIVILPPLLIL